MSRFRFFFLFRDFSVSCLVSRFVMFVPCLVRVSFRVSSFHVSSCVVPCLVRVSSRVSCCVSAFFLCLSMRPCDNHLCVRLHLVATFTATLSRGVVRRALLFIIHACAPCPCLLHAFMTVFLLCVCLCHHLHTTHHTSIFFAPTACVHTHHCAVCTCVCVSVFLCFFPVCVSVSMHTTHHHFYTYTHASMCVCVWAQARPVVAGPRVPLIKKGMRVVSYPTHQSCEGNSHASLYMSLYMYICIFVTPCCTVYIFMLVCHFYMLACLYVHVVPPYCFAC